MRYMTPLVSLTSFLFIGLFIHISACGTAPPSPVKPPETSPTPTQPQPAQETSSKQIKEPNESPSDPNKSKQESEVKDGEEGSTDNTEEKTKALEESYQILIKAQDQMKSNSLEEAQQLLQRVSARTPNIPEAHYNLGVIAERSGLPQVARQHYQDALKAKPDFSPAWLALVRFSLRVNNPQGALNDVESKLREDRDNIALLNAKSRVLIYLNQRQNEVIKSSKHILRMDEQNVPAMIHLASAYAQEEKHELSLAILKNAKELDPTNPEIYSRIAQSQAALNEVLRARFTLEEAVKIPSL